VRISAVGCWFCYKFCASYNLQNHTVEHTFNMKLLKYTEADLIQVKKSHNICFKDVYLSCKLSVNYFTR